MDKVKTTINVITFGGPEFSDFSNAPIDLPLTTRGGCNYLADLLDETE